MQVEVGTQSWCWGGELTTLSRAHNLPVMKDEFVSVRFFALPLGFDVGAVDDERRLAAAKLEPFAGPGWR